MYKAGKKYNKLIFLAFLTEHFSVDSSFIAVLSNLFSPLPPKLFF